MASLASYFNDSEKHFSRKEDIVIDHTGIIVSDFTKSKKWYTEPLAPIGYIKLMEFRKKLLKPQLLMALVKR